MKHCETCTCEAEESDFRARQKKLYRHVPDTGCLFYSLTQDPWGYCNKPCAGKSDKCKEHGGK